jgi:hypothetical protein
MKRYVWVVSMVAVVAVALFTTGRRYAATGAGQGAVDPAVAQNAPQAVTPNVGTATSYFSPYAQAIALVQHTTLRGRKGISSFTHPTTGVYCLKLASGIQFANTAPVVSIEWGSSLGVVNFAQWDQANVDCGGGSTSNVIEVRTYKGDTGGVGSNYQIPVLSDRVSFVVLVP